MFVLTAEETRALRSKISSLGQGGDLRSKISTTKLSPKSRGMPKAFTEKGLYMLATILKSKCATAATFAIIETFAKVRGLKRELVELHKEGDKRNSSKVDFAEPPRIKKSVFMPTSNSATSRIRCSNRGKECSLLDDISGLADSMMSLYRQSYDVLLPVVDDMCRRKETVTQNELDHCFDSVSEIASPDFGKKLFDRLCVAFKSKYPESVDFYIKDYEKFYGDGEEGNDAATSKVKKRESRSCAGNGKKGGLK